jgi:hypothetical protein
LRFPTEAGPDANLSGAGRGIQATNGSDTSRDETAKIADRLRTLHRDGSLFIETFDTLVMNSFLYPSDLVPGLQLADFVAALLTSS